MGAESLLPHENRLLDGLTDPGTLWPEAREFLRVHGHQPHAQSALVKSLAGLYANASQGYRPNTNSGDGRMANEEAAHCIAGTIRYLREQFPEWASQEVFELDNDFRLPDYPGCSPFMKTFIEQEILGGDFDKGGVE